MIDLHQIQSLFSAFRRFGWRPALQPVRRKRSLVRPGAFWMAAFLLLGATAAQAQVSGISYTVSPIGQRIYWDGDAALDDGFLYGGELGFGFGEYVELSAVYLFGNNFDTDFSDLSADRLIPLGRLPSRTVDIQRYGGRLRLNLGRGSFVPFVTAGTGIIRFNPEGLDATENIYAEGAVGVTFSVANRYTLSVAGQGLGYRYNLSTTFLTDEDLALVDLNREDFEQESVFNPAISASLKFYLGGRDQNQLTEVDRAFMSQFRGGNFRLAVEPFYGQIDFNKELGFPDEQRVAGVNAGIDLGPYLGLRGFYWRGSDRGNVTDFESIQFYGGELDFRFQQELGGSFTPYLIFGGGYVDVDAEAYAEETGFGPESRYFAIGGAGVEVPLSPAVKLQAGVRSLLMSTEDVEDVSAPSNVYSSLMYTAGLNFNLGGSGRTAGSVIGRDVAAARAEARDRDAMMEQQLAAIQARLDSLETARAAMPPVMIDSLGAPMAAQPTIVMERDTVVVQEARRSNLSGQTITIPVPEEGEIYIRFGAAPATPVETTYAPPMILGMTPQMMPAPAASPSPAAQPSATIPVRVDTSMVGALTLEQLRQIVGQAVAEQQQTQQGGLTAAELDQSLRRMETRIEQRIARESNLLREDMEAQPRPAQRATPADTTTTGGLFGDFGERQLVAAYPFVGLRVGNGPAQFLAGVRGDYRFSNRSFRFLPEVALGFGDKIALNAFANVAWDVGRIGPVRPYVGPGVGFVSDRGLSGLQLAFNLLAGAEYTTLGGGTFFGEYSSLDFFDFSRFLVGYRLRF